ncbi:hypothetical protein [Roseibium sp. MMSF_3412]|uniref:hypothetical protein n=1 Tax=Roseibium sp. MMSF_3412 TaxID=3046712 RepID=UPI00273D5152|nr:hypothetical protein [Roseibium sp. MMSF_3412]
MSDQGSQSTGYFSPAFLAGSLVVFVSACIALAQEAPKPTFLESGDNDLIRFQMGGVPTAPLGEARALATTVSEAVPVISPATAPEALKEEAADEQMAKAPATRRTELAKRAEETPSKPIRTFAVAPPAGILGAPEAADQPTVPQPKPAPERARQNSVAAQTSSALFDSATPDVSGLAPSSDLEAASRAYANTVRAAPQKGAEPQPVLSEEVNARLVTICLNNPEEANGAKAFDIRREGPPRYVADIGSSACARFEPTRHTLYLWKTNDIGALSLIVSNRLDLNGEDGTQVTLDWLRDQ